MQDQVIIKLLNYISWIKLSPLWPNDTIREWLTEHGSMTQRLESYCEKIHVRRVREGYISAYPKLDEMTLLPVSKKFWIREVILYGHNYPWMTARTLIPTITKIDIIKELENLGDIPLGKWLFRYQPPKRDILQFGKVGKLWARRTRLLAKDQLLLLTEIFLPDSPLYTEKVLTHKELKKT